MTRHEPDPAAVAREERRVERVFQRYSPEERANRAASHRLGPRQRKAVGEFFYTHPDVPRRAFPSRQAAARAAVEAKTRQAHAGSGARSDPPRYQPVPAPGNWEDFIALLRSGVLIDLGGRPLRWERCQDCEGWGVSGTTCPLAVACPTCNAQPRQPCRRNRPSGHVMSEAFQPTHKARIQAAGEVDSQRERDGDPTVPARWPTSPQPTPQASGEQVPRALPQAADAPPAPRVRPPAASLVETPAQGTLFDLIEPPARRPAAVPVGGGR